MCAINQARLFWLPLLLMLMRPLPRCHGLPLLSLLPKMTGLLGLLLVALQSPCMWVLSCLLWTGRCRRFLLLTPR